MGTGMIMACVNFMEQEIDWLRFLRIVFSEVDINISDTEEIVVLFPDYVMELGRLLQNTSPRSVTRLLSLQTLFPGKSLVGMKAGSRGHKLMRNVECAKILDARSLSN